jgi:hypothetical protein
VFFFVECLPEGGLERPEHVGGLPHVFFITNYIEGGGTFVYGELRHWTARGLFPITRAVCRVRVLRLFVFGNVFTAV